MSGNYNNYPPAETGHNPWAEETDNIPHSAAPDYSDRQAYQSNVWQNPSPVYDPAVAQHSTPQQQPQQAYRSHQWQNPNSAYDPPEVTENSNPWESSTGRLPAQVQHQAQQHQHEQRRHPGPHYQPQNNSTSTGGPPLPVRRSSFKEETFVPPSERGEQREAMEQFELSNSKPQSTDDRNVEKLQAEFPGLDGALVAAIYGDSRDMGATREMLGELSG